MLETNKGSKNSGIPVKVAKEDRRIRRTKKLLKDALIALITERGYEETSVQEIIDRADVGRTSFYTYFRNKEDLLLQSLDDMSEMFTPASGGEPIQNTEQISLILLRHLNERRDLARSLLGDRSFPIVRDHFQTILLESYAERFQSRYGKTKNKFQIEGAAVFASGALLSMILWWLAMKRPASAETVNELFLELMSKKLS